MSTITLDMITNMIRTERNDLDPSAQGVMLADVIRSIDAAEASATPAKARKAKPAPAVKADWREMSVSRSQIARFNRLESALNAHYGEDCALSVAGDFTNKGDASDQYKALAAEGTRLGLSWAA